MFVIRADTAAGPLYFAEIDTTTGEPQFASLPAKVSAYPEPPTLLLAWIKTYTTSPLSIMEVAQ